MKIVLRTDTGSALIFSQSWREVVRNKSLLSIIRLAKSRLKLTYGELFCQLFSQLAKIKKMDNFAFIFCFKECLRGIPQEFVPSLFGKLSI